MSKEVRNTPIEDLDLSIRSFGLLQELGVKTVVELLDRSASGLPTTCSPKSAQTLPGARVWS